MERSICDTLKPDLAIVALSSRLVESRPLLWLVPDKIDGLAGGRLRYIRNPVSRHYGTVEDLVKWQNTSLST